MKVFFSTLIFKRYLDFIIASAESSADSPIIRFPISTAIDGMSSEIVWGSLHFAILCATFVRCLQSIASSGVVGRERGGPPFPHFFQGGNAIPHYFAAFLAFLNTIRSEERRV